jgi:hypothetical protein
MTNFPCFKLGGISDKHSNFIDVAKGPGPRRIEGTHDRVAGLPKMALRVSVPGVVAAAHVTARAADPKLDPPRAPGHTPFAAVGPLQSARDRKQMAAAQFPFSRGHCPQHQRHF